MRVAVLQSSSAASSGRLNFLAGILNELGYDADWIEQVGAADGVEVLVVGLDAAQCERWAHLPQETELPLVAIIQNDVDEEAELSLTRAGFHECVPLEEVTAGSMRRALRRANARTQSPPVVKETAPAAPLPPPSNDFGCPSCGAATESHVDLCADCGASFSAEVAPTLETPPNGEASGSSMIGQTFAGYTFTGLVQVGAFGAVYSARRDADDQTVAIKLLNTWLEGPGDALFRFRREGSIQRKLVHPHIVQVLDRLTIGNRPAIVMEFINGFTLRSYIDSGEGALSPHTSLIRFLEMLDGVAYAHQHGVVHRDIKPANILVDVTTDPHAWKLTDFGLAKMKGTPGQTQAGQVLGTARYMSPEQISDPGDADQRADLYSLACCLFEVLTGASPFPHQSDLRAMVAQLHDAAEHLSDANPDIPPAVGDVVARALSKRPEDRYGTCASFAEALRAAVREMGIHA